MVARTVTGCEETNALQLGIRALLTQSTVPQFVPEVRLAPRSASAAAPPSRNAASAWSRSSRVWAAEIWQRTRAWPWGTTGIAEAGDEHALGQQQVAHPDRRGGLAQDDRDDRGLAGERLEAELEQPLAEVAGVVAQGGDPLGMGLEILDAGERAGRHGRRQRVGEELRPRALGEVVAHRRRAGDEAAGRAARAPCPAWR